MEFKKDYRLHWSAYDPIFETDLHYQVDIYSKDLSFTVSYVFRTYVVKTLEVIKLL